MEKRLESLDLNLLLVLHWLLTEQNVTAAADKIGLSQPATSRALARLREVFDDPLLVKTGGEMSPTPMAERLQPAVARAIERCRDVLRVSSRFEPSSQAGQFRIACVDFTGAMAAMAWAKVIAPEAPGLELDIVNPTIAASRDLVSGKIDLVILPDIAVLELPPSVDIDQFVRRPILQQEFQCAFRKNHPMAGENITLKRYAAMDHVLVAPQGGKTGFVDRSLAEQGLTRRIAYRTSTFLLALPILMKTDCVLTAPIGMLQLYAENLVIFPPPFKVAGNTLFGAWHPNWTHDERHRWVREKLFAEMALEAEQIRGRAGK